MEAVRTLPLLYLHNHRSAQEDSCMSESGGHFKGIRRLIWLAVGFLLLAAALESAIYIVVHLLNY